MRVWLYGNAGLTLGMIAVGGLTRLTESGLSITEWKPVTGAIPPLTKENWESEFDKVPCL
jgi:cytochrome c oxidase assembly protein subunit 15